MERRQCNRAVRMENDGKTLVGYGAVFYRADDPGTEFELWPGMVERIKPTAFSGIGSDDVRALFNHNSSSILGRNKAGTLRLTVDDIGLRYEVDMPDTQAAKDAAISIKRGDVTGSSFAFGIRDEGEEITMEGQTQVRWLTAVRAGDVGPVTYPAYEATSTAMRSIDELKERLKAEDTILTDADIALMDMDLALLKAKEPFI